MISLIHDSVIMSDKYVEKSETVTVKYVDRKLTNKINHCISHTIVLVSVFLLLLITIAISCH